MNYFRRFRDAAICVALLAVPFLFLNANLKEARTGSEPGFVDRLVLQASAPVQYVATQAAHSVSDLLEEYVFLLEVKGDNERLRGEIARIREENRELRVQARENRRLRELLGVRERLGTETITARVIGKDISNFFRVMRVVVDRGQRDRVSHGMPVVSSQGLVGQVNKAWGRYADVMLTIDEHSKIDVVIPSTGARGMLLGTASNEYVCRIQYLKRTDEVQVGDEIYTSGYGKRFPASILVGRVSKVKRRDFGLYQAVEVKPAVDFSALEEVLILTASSRSGMAEARAESALEGP
jgi:rod shape-determining protein MreC